MNTISGLAISNDKKNKTRSILIIVSITLTTMLLTAIAGFCYGTIQSNIKNAGSRYGSFYGVYKGVTEEQIQKMKLRSEFSDIGKMAFAGIVESKKDIQLLWLDETSRNLTNMNEYLEEGSFPENKDEIIAEKSFFEELGVKNPNIGDKIQFNSRADSNSIYQKQEFIIRGFLKQPVIDLEKKRYAAYVAKEFYESQVTEDKRKYQAYFRLNDSVKITSGGAEERLKELAKKCGISEKMVMVNNGYLDWALEPDKDTIVVGIVIACCVILFSVVVIYNIFQVGIVQKIQEYGKLKALGATRKQMKRLVLLEGMMLSVSGVPLGLLTGCILAKVSFSWLMEQANKQIIGNDLVEVSIFSVPVLLLVVVVSFLTVYLALRKPMKIVTKLSPMEAVRYQENTDTKQSLRKGKKNVSVRDMTLANLSGNKKRTITTVCTMGLSCVLFITIASLVGSMDSEYEARRSVEHGKFQISLDCSVDDKAYPENNLDNILKDNPLGKDILTRLKQIPGVTEVKTRKILAMKEKGKLSSVSVMNKEDFKNLKSSGSILGKVDYDTASKENALLYGLANWMNENGYFLNQNIQAQLENGTSEISFSGSLQGSFSVCNEDFVITEDTYQKLGFKDDGIGYIWVDCKEKDVITVQKELNEMFSNMEHVEIETYQDALKNVKFSIRLMKLMAYTLLAIIGFIGFMNVANTMIVNIVTRKQELGVLQAIGMTNRQLSRMLQMEGLIFTVGTVLVAMVVGVPAGYAFFLYGKKSTVIGVNIYHFPVTEILMMIGVIAILQIILSIILSRNVRKQSLIERIRYHE